MWPVLFQHQKQVRIQKKKKNYGQVSLTNTDAKILNKTTSPLSKGYRSLTQCLPSKCEALS